MLSDKRSLEISVWPAAQDLSAFPNSLGPSQWQELLLLPHCPGDAGQDLLRINLFPHQEKFPFRDPSLEDVPSSYQELSLEEFTSHNSSKPSFYLQHPREKKKKGRSLVCFYPGKIRTCLWHWDIFAWHSREIQKLSCFHLEKKLCLCTLRLEGLFQMPNFIFRTCKVTHVISYNHSEYTYSKFMPKNGCNKANWSHRTQGKKKEITRKLNNNAVREREKNKLQKPGRIVLSFLLEISLLVSNILHNSFVLVDLNHLLTSWCNQILFFPSVVLCWEIPVPRKFLLLAAKFQ